MKQDKAEYVKRHDELRRRLKAGDITDLIVGPKWACYVAGVHVTVVEADFAYRLVQRGTSVAEFLNVPNSALHSIKKKLLKACHHIESEEVRA